MSWAITAEGQAGHGRPDRPAGQGAALEPPGQGERAAQPGRRGGRPQPGRQHPGAQVAPDEQGRGRRQQDHRAAATGRSRTSQRSPANGRNRSAQPMGDSHDSQDSSVDGVADGPEQEGRAQHGEGHPVGGPGVLGQLDGDRGDAGEDQAVEAAADGQGDRPGRREAHGDVPGGGDRGQHDVDRQHEQQAGGQPGVPADHAGARPARPGRSPPPGGCAGSPAACSSGRCRKTPGVTTCQAVAPP